MTRATRYPPELRERAIPLVREHTAGGESMLDPAPSIMPPLALPETAELTRIISAGNMVTAETPVVAYRPFATTRHTVSNAGLASGGPEAGSGR